MSVRTLQELCQEAIAIQVACNLTGLVHLLAQTAVELRALFPYEPTEFFNRHPIITLWLDKLCDLNGRVYDSDEYSKALQVVTGIANS